MQLKLLLSSRSSVGKRMGPEIRSSMDEGWTYRFCKQEKNPFISENMEGSALLIFLAVGNWKLSGQKVQLQKPCKTSADNVEIADLMDFDSLGFMDCLCYLRPVRGCTRGAWVTAAAAAAAAAEDGVGCFGLLTLVLLFANSSLIVWGRSGSKRTPCCNHQQETIMEQCPDNVLTYNKHSFPQAGQFQARQPKIWQIIVW